MKIIRYTGEFTWDMVSVSPHAYWLYQNNIEFKTIGPIGTKAIYFFDKEHEESGNRSSPVIWGLDRLQHQGCIVDIYNINPERTQWSPPPYKKTFKNKLFLYDKPLIIINNKYTEEWGNPPLNFLSEEFLDKFFNKFCNDFQIIYIRPEGKEKGYSSDDNIHFDYSDKEMCKKYDVILIETLLKEYPYLSFNEIQFMVCANSERFISVTGGNAAVCSYFGGINLVFNAQENNHLQEGKGGYYEELSGAKCEIFTNYESLFEASIKYF